MAHLKSRKATRKASRKSNRKMNRKGSRVSKKSRKVSRKMNRKSRKMNRKSTRRFFGGFQQMEMEDFAINTRRQPPTQMNTPSRMAATMVPESQGGNNLETTTGPSTGLTASSIPRN